MFAFCVPFYICRIPSQSSILSLCSWWFPCMLGHHDREDVVTTVYSKIWELFQHLTNLLVKNFPLISNLNLSFFNTIFPCPAIIYPCKELSSLYFICIQYFTQMCFMTLQSTGVTGNAIDTIIWNPVIKRNTL